MVCYAEQDNQLKSARGNSGISPFCVTTLADFLLEIIMELLECHSCKKIKPEDEFYHNPRKNRTRKRDYWCKTCHSEYSYKHNQKPEVKERNRINQAKPENRKRKSLRQKEWKKENPMGSLEAHYKWLYKIDLQDYFNLLKKQRNLCAICGIHIDQIKQRVFDVDHCHKTGQVRGLLCRKCNTRLRVLDNQEWVKKAKKYLEALKAQLNGYQSVYKHISEV